MSDTFLVSLLAGGTAGLCVDIALFPLDTIKTRIQSSQGFLKAGGFRGIYSGIGSAASGSAPAAATFFCTYEMIKNSVAYWAPNVSTPFVHMLAASIGELTSNIVRVPFELVKQRAQAYQNMSSLQVFRFTLRQEGFKGLYRGYWNTVFREVPFSFIQYPLWEFLKMRWSKYQSHHDAWQSAVCGALAGSVAAALTTPLDVAKTRVMLAQKDCPTTKVNPFRVLILIGKDEGLKKLFSGIVPRVLWISIGGAIFLGVYDETRILLNHRIKE